MFLVIIERWLRHTIHNNSKFNGIDCFHSLTFLVNIASSCLDPYRYTCWFLIFETSRYKHIVPYFLTFAIMKNSINKPLFNIHKKQEIANTSYFFLYFSNASFASKCTSLMNAMLQITYAAIAI